MGQVEYQPSIDLGQLQSQLLRDDHRSWAIVLRCSNTVPLIAQSRPVVNAPSTQSRNAAHRAHERDTKTKAARTQSLAPVTGTFTIPQSDSCVLSRDDAYTNISFLSDTIPETIEHITEGEYTARSLPMDGKITFQSQASDGATQEISQSALEVIRSRGEQPALVGSVEADGADYLDGDEDELPNTLAIEEEDLLQHTLEEGDPAFLDIASSFAAPPLTQFPESQRFKTPAHPVAGRKRDHNGNVVTTPAVSRNPFARDNNVDISAGLSQAFAQTQAASSPCQVAPTPGLRSDRPSPGIEVEKHVLHPPTSSPLRPLSEVKRAITEPATRYVAYGHSQLLRSGSVDPQNPTDLTDRGQPSLTQSTNGEAFDDSEESILLRQRRARQREARAREQLKSASSPLSPEKHDFPVLERRAVSARPASPRRTSTKTLPSSPPLLPPTDQDDGESGQNAAWVTKFAVAKPSDTLPIGRIVANESSQSRSSHDRRIATIIPETTRRRDNLPALSQSFPPTQPSPSMRQTRHRVDIISRSGPVRVVNSQRSAPSTQDLAHKFPGASSGGSIDVIPASPEGQLVATQPSHPTKRGKGESTIAVVSDEDNSNDGENHGNDLASTIMETYSGSASNLGPGNNERTATHILQAPDDDTVEPDWSSQPVQFPPGRKRKRMEDISQDDTTPQATQTSIFDPAEALALDEDPETALALASTQDEDPVRFRKRSRRLQTVFAPPSPLEETMPLVRTPHAISNRPKGLHIAQSDSPDREDIENMAQTDGLAISVVGAAYRTPTKRPEKRSAWDVGESPQQKHIPRAIKQSVLPTKNASRQKANPRDGIATKTRPRTPATRPCMEETSPDPLAISTTSTTPPVVQARPDRVLAPNMVFAYYMARTRIYYPAICVGSSSETQHYTIQWPGPYDVEEMGKHALCSLDLRVGDEVKIDQDRFPNIGFVVTGFSTLQDHSETKDMITDIYGHTHVFLKPKNPKQALLKNVSMDDPIPIQNVYVHTNVWRKINERPFVLKDHQPRVEVGGTFTPVDRAQTPSTPSSRGRLAARDTVIQPAQKEGVFANMVFALSFESDVQRSKVSKSISDNGGLILDSSFRDLVDEDLKLREHFLHLGFAALIADKHSRKEKYMQALALGLPCLSMRWTEVCVKQSELADWQDYLLPAGESRELGGAIRSRTLARRDFVDYDLAQTVASRPRFFHGCSGVFVTGKGKGMDKRTPHEFFIQVMGAKIVDKVQDLSTAKLRLQASKVDGTSTWLFVDDRDLPAACKVVEDVKRERIGSGKRRSTDLPWSCDVADSEFVLQSLILGRLCPRD